MTAEERSLLQEVDRVLGLEQVHAQIRPIVERVRAELARKEDALMAVGADRADTVRRSPTGGDPLQLGVCSTCGREYWSRATSEQSSTDDVVRSNRGYAN
jgi:hypothetical protein